MRHASRAIGRTAALAFATLFFAAPAGAQESEASWNSIRPQIFAERPIGDGAALIELAAPSRAEDAAIVPLDVRLRASGDTKLKTLTVVIDENPSPVVAVFKLGDRLAFDIATRVRVDRYSHVRAIVETDDGKLHMVKAFVKAAGGCSAPATKDPVEAKANIGEMRFRSFANVGRQEAQVQIRHPNYSGLQMDQVTRHYTQAWFVESLTVRQGDRTLFSMEGGISISEDPTFRFAYRSTGEPVTVEARDTEGAIFRRTFPAGEAS